MSKTGLFLVKLVIGNENLPGAPIVHFTGAVNAAKGVINGSAEITQSVTPPGGEIEVPNVTGVIRQAGLGPNKLLVTLQGSYLVSVPPPAIGTYLAKFEAALVLDGEWNGHGSFSYSGHTVNDVPVKSLS